MMFEILCLPIELMQQQLPIMSFKGGVGPS
jgi:hypothetical protein